MFSESGYLSPEEARSQEKVVPSLPELSPEERASLEAELAEINQRITVSAGVMDATDSNRRRDIERELGIEPQTDEMAA